jgi:hypothetical protein
VQHQLRRSEVQIETVSERFREDRRNRLSRVEPARDPKARAHRSATVVIPSLLRMSVAGRVKDLIRQTEMERCDTVLTTGLL